MEFTRVRCTKCANIFKIEKTKLTDPYLCSKCLEVKAEN